MKSKKYTLWASALLIGAFFVSGQLTAGRGGGGHGGGGHAPAHGGGGHRAAPAHRGGEHHAATAHRGEHRGDAGHRDGAWNHGGYWGRDGNWWGAPTVGLGLGLAAAGTAYDTTTYVTDSSDDQIIAEQQARIQALEADEA